MNWTSGAGEVSTVTCLTDCEDNISASSYFFLHAFDSKKQLRRFAIWFDTTGTDTPPDLDYVVEIQVDISAAVDNGDVADAIETALEAYDDNWGQQIFSVSVASNVATITNSYKGNVPDLYDYNVGGTNITLAKSSDGSGVDGFIGIFEDKGSWVTTNDPGNIDLNDFDGYGDDYIILPTEDWSFVVDPDERHKKLPLHLNITLGIGHVADVIQLSCYVMDGMEVDSSSKNAEELIARILNFVYTHSKIGDEACYLVIRRNVNDAWSYHTFSNPDESFVRYGANSINYMKCIMDSGKPKRREFGVIDIKIQCLEITI